MKRGFSYGEFEIAVEFVILSNEYHFAVYEAVLFVLLFSMGLTFTASTTLAMDCERANSGTASALFGAAGFAFGGIVSPLVGLGDILSTTGLIFFVCSVCSLCFSVSNVRWGLLLGLSF